MLSSLQTKVASISREIEWLLIVLRWDIWIDPKKSGVNCWCSAQQNPVSSRFLPTLNSELELLNWINSESSRCNSCVIGTNPGKKNDLSLQIDIKLSQTWGSSTSTRTLRNPVVQPSDLVKFLVAFLDLGAVDSNSLQYLIDSLVNANRSTRYVTYDTLNDKKMVIGSCLVSSWHRIYAAEKGTVSTRLNN